MSALATLSSVLRILMLSLLMAGVVVKPVLAVQCEIRGAQQGVAGTSQITMSETPAPDAGDGCCTQQNCNDCCAHTAALIPSSDAAPAVAIATSVLPTLSIDFEPTGFSAAFRPPIAA